MKRISLSLLVLLGLGLLVVLSVAVRESRRGVAEFQSGGMDEAQFARFLADQQRLAALGVFPLERGTHDAGELLNRWVALDGGTPEEMKPDEVAWWAAPAVADAVKCKEATDPDRPKFIQCMDQAPEGDLSFMASLEAYDTWDPSSSGAWKRYLAAHPREQAWTAAIPNYISLQTLARLRLIQGLKAGDPLPALREVRQLARLTWSTETLVGAMVAVAILKFEREGYEEAVARGQIPAEAWTTLSAEDAEAFKRVLWTLQGLYMGLGPADGLTRLTAVVPHPVGMCPSSAEAALNLRLVRALFTEPWPGEIDLSATLGPLDDLMSSGACRGVFVGELWRDRSRDLDVLQIDEPTGSLVRWRWLTGVPWVRQGIGGILLAIGPPDLNRYDE